MANWREYLPHRWSRAERHCVLLCRNEEVARGVLAQCAAAEIGVEWFTNGEDWEPDDETFYIVFVPIAERSFWEETLEEKAYPRQRGLVNWF